MEIFIVGAIFVFILVYNRNIDGEKFIQDNKMLLDKLKEDDFEFLVAARYGDKKTPDEIFPKRFKNGGLVIVIFLFVFLTELSLINIVLSILVGYFVYKIEYTNLKKYYKRHLHEIDVMLPYYLKGLEILVQHYTVPVALAKSIPEAPDVFKPGLREMIAKIDAGDSSIQPYMDFANQYPVRDSMRMMRLLYRLGLGSQERKQERLLMFSRTVSNLQAKARDQKHKERIEHMEGQTIVMLVATGAGVMVLILIAMIYMFTNL